MGFLPAAFALAFAGCTTAGGNYATMQSFVGMTIGQMIVGNGQPESRVRLNDREVAYTFHFNRQWVSGSGGYINTNMVDCRFTFIVEQRGDHDDRAVVSRVMDPGPDCR